MSSILLKLDLTNTTPLIALIDVAILWFKIIALRFRRLHLISTYFFSSNSCDISVIPLFGLTLGTEYLKISLAFSLFTICFITVSRNSPLISSIWMSCKTPFFFTVTVLFLSFFWLMILSIFYSSHFSLYKELLYLCIWTVKPKRLGWLSPFITISFLSFSSFVRSGISLFLTSRSQVLRIYSPNSW